MDFGYHWPFAKKFFNLRNALIFRGRNENGWNYSEAVNVLSQTCVLAPNFFEGGRPGSVDRILKTNRAAG